MPDLYFGKDLAKKITYITMSMPIILSLAPIIGGHLYEYFSWRITFLCLILYYIILFFSIIKTKETIKNFSRNKFSAITNYKNLCKNSQFVFMECVVLFLLLECMRM